jgi:two-component system nitrogen regulation response regulator GlnG
MQNTILIADDDAAIRTVLAQALGRAGHDVRTAASAAGLWEMVEVGEGNVVVTDVILPDENGFDLIPRIKQARPELPIVVMSAHNTIATAITAAEHGAFEYLPKPFDLKELKAVVQRALECRPRKASSRSTGSDDALPLIGRSPAMQKVYRAIARLTQSDLTVLITGESGTGKERIARVLHDYGLRRHGPFVAVNVAAIPRELVESELFGHERGAFTGATARAIGRFEQAEGGTLFLDEIGDMPREAQTRLLRVLQEGEFTSVGGRGAMKTNVRLIAATNRDVAQLVRDGQFRADLFYRLNVVPLRVPPLRERVEDIPDLVRHFLQRSAGEQGKSIAPDAIEGLQRHSWPGNVRELENLIRRLVVLRPEATIAVDAIVQELASTSPPQQEETLASVLERHLVQIVAARLDGSLPSGLYKRVLANVERPLLKLCLEAVGGNQVRAAELLGLNRNTLRKKLREFGF